MAQCYIHAQKEAQHQCVQCGKDACASCTTVVEGEPFCELCWDRCVLTSVPPVMDEPLSGADLGPAPWQRWRELGMPNAFIITARELAFAPQAFFSRIRSSTPTGAALLFAVICTMLIWYPVQIFYLVILFPAILAQMSAQAASDPRMAELAAEMSAKFEAVTTSTILFLPVAYLFYYLILGSLAQHGLIMLFRGRQGYSATFQVRCYALIMQVLALIPFVGLLLAEVATVIVCAMGFRVAQGITVPQSFLVATVPLIFLVLMVPSPM
jgi:hypothetical protein